MVAFERERGYTLARMTFDRRSHFLPPALWPAAICFVVAAQFFVVFAPVLEGHFGPDARSHVEAMGGHAHHAHNPADCAACAARSLQAATNHPANSVVALHHGVPRVGAKRDHDIGFLKGKSSRPRAPPIRQA